MQRPIGGVVFALAPVALLAAGLWAIAARPAGSAAQEDEKQPVFVNLTSGTNDLHAACMGLGLAQNALKDGRKVTVFVNVHAPKLATRGLSRNVKFMDFPPVRDMVASLIKGGARVLVCEHCAHLVGVREKDLARGARIARHGDVFRAAHPHSLCFSY